MEILSHRIRTGAGQLGNSRSNLEVLYHMGINWIEADISFGQNGKILISHPGKVKPNADVMDLLTFLGIIVSIPKLHCCLDIKPDPGKTDEEETSRELVRRAVSLITKLRIQDRVYLTAFQRKVRIPFIARLETNGELLLFAKALNPQIRTHIIATWPWNLPKIVKKYRADAISFGWLLEPAAAGFISKVLFKTSASFRNLAGQVSELRSLGIKVWAGIFNDPEDMLYLAGLGVDGIMTDEPKVMLDLIKSKRIS